MLDVSAVLNVFLMTEIVANYTQGELKLDKIYDD